MLNFKAGRATFPLLNYSATLAKYEYDSADRLIREDNRYYINKTSLYSYDNNGNIIQKSGAYTPAELTGAVERHIYSDGRLLAYNNQGCWYDSSGNPEIYRSEAMEWEYGKRLVKYGTNTFGYSADGTRIKKNDIIFKYDCAGRLIKQSDGLEFYYDGEEVIGFTYEGSNYLYRKDVQGNVIGILDKNGKEVVSYYYEAFGNCQVLAIEGYLPLGHLNPFRYRSYYYDTETKLYYLKSRYYDPEVGRFISQDNVAYADPDSINGLNLYAYCGNNPVMNVDTNGCDYISFIENANGFFADLSVILGKTLLGLGTATLNSLSNLSMYLLDGTGGAILNPAYLQGLDVYTNLDYLGKVLSTAGKVLKIAGYAFLAMDIGFILYDNITNPNLSLSRKITDSIFDIGYSLLGFGLSSACVSLGMMVGGPVGAIGGAVIGLFLNILLAGFKTECRETYNELKIGFNIFITETIPNAWNDFVDGWHWFWSFEWAK